MKHLYTTGLLLLIFSQAAAQKTAPLYEAYFHHPDEMVEDEGGGYHFRIGDTLMVSMSDDGYYKLMTIEGDILEEGDTDEGDENFVRHGKWTEYYSAGKPRASGNYFKNQPYGHWQFFNNNGQPTSECSILALTNEDGVTVYCKTGAELVYYDNGKLKEERFFKAEPYVGEERIQVEDPETGKKAWKRMPLKTFRPKPFGTWVYYNADGTVEKKEDKKD